MADTEGDRSHTSKIKVVICPYCGETQPASERCRVCTGLFEPLSRQATHNAMGPWFIRNPNNPYQPGCSYETLVKMVDRGQINRYTIVRGPTTKQFWTVARHTPGVAHLLGYCHNCDAQVSKKDLGCAKCGAPFGAYLERNYLGLPEVRSMPWEGGDEPAVETSDQWGAHFGRPRPQATGISSFGTDEELSAGGRFSSESGTMPPPRMNGGGLGLAGSASVPAAGPPVATSPAGISSGLDRALGDDDSSYAAARQRALERRLAQQTRTIRWLAVVMGALAVAAAVFAFQALSGGGSDSQQESESSTAAASEDQVQTPPRAGDEGGAASEDEQSQDAPLAPEPPSEEEVEGGEEGSSEESGGPRASPVNDRQQDADDPFLAQFAQAQQMIERSKDETLEIEERMRLVSAAIAALEQIAAAAPPGSRPEGLDALIEAQERELKRLELKKWFR